MTEEEFWGRSPTFKVGTTITDDRLITSTVDLAGAVHRRVLDTQEVQVRAALIALGWTPPEGVILVTPD